MTEQNLDNAEIGDQKCKIDSYSQQEDQTNEEQEEDYTAQCYQLLEEIRNDLVQSGQTGPRAMIIGETDSGKSTLSKILFNEAVKIGRKPIFVDLDPGQNEIYPGVILASIINEQIAINDPYPPFNNPLIYFIGSVDIISNYKRLIQMMHSMIDDIERIQDMNKDIRDSGIIINTCGWVQGLGFELQKKTAQLFKCDVIINLSDDALQDQLRTSLLIDSMTNENVQNSTAPKEGSSKDLFPNKSKEKVNEDKMNQLIDEQQNEQKKDSEEGKKISIVDKEIELEVKKEMNDKQESIIEKDKDNEKKEVVTQARLRIWFGELC
ncbi:MAG: putative pre-mRNA cleavage complex subunit [Streblomastix strix]|uniref:Putative pre-mRNA cleavage complex subunit n=1 Tax=Streblomastix strix TaxID=222440 RepID=A0A5J4VU72_9EUKA|nr:MAG: putative pre-mRNA cleavage complex subunit [Streblomastix strix]